MNNILSKDITDDICSPKLDRKIKKENGKILFMCI